MGTPRGLFLNSPKGNCSIYESGLMAFDAIKDSSAYTIEYSELTESSRSISANYDFYLFNFHPATMAWLDQESVRKLPGLKMTFVLETLPNDPFAMVSPETFDIYLPIDPTIVPERGRIYPMCRPIEKGAIGSGDLEVPAKPIIGTFGFGTPGKGFEFVVDAVNREFDSAIVRINVPPGTHTDEKNWRIQRRNYAEYLEELCRKVAKPGIEIEFTRDFFTKAQLIEWCSKNTLNCFLYNRLQPGLSATTDQAISSGRPLAVSVNPTFRHIHQFVEAYPFRSLKDSIKKSGSEVAALQRLWTRQAFADQFTAVIAENRDRMGNGSSEVPRSKIKFRKLAPPSEPVFRNWIESKKVDLHHRLDATPRGRRMKKRLIGYKHRIFGEPAPVPVVYQDPSIGKRLGGVLIISHAEKQCGIHQYGLNISTALQASRKHDYVHRTASSREELLAHIRELRPKAIIYNYYPITMPWLDSGITRSIDLPQIGVIHEITQQVADSAGTEMFDYHLAPDPDLKTKNPVVFATPRLIPEYFNYLPTPEIPRFGSFGFGFKNKGFERVIEQVQTEYDEAVIVLRLPFNDLVDKVGMDHALATAERCRALVKKPKIRLEIHHDFLTREKLLHSLAVNTANIFFYDVNLHKGISSTIEHALAVQRPLIINRCGMFRHVHNLKSSICIEDRSIRQIVETGIAPLVPKFAEWSPARFVMAYDQIVDLVLAKKGIRKDRSNPSPTEKEESDRV